MELHPHFHLDPPLTPRAVLLRHPAVLWLVGGAATTLALLASVRGGTILLTVDEPIQHWIEAQRTPGWTRFALSFSRLGSTLVVFAVFSVVAVWTLRRCRVLALTLCVAVLLRPPLEFVLKELIGRDRPDFHRLVDGTGPSHPSGHVLAAVALWGLLPPLVSAFTRRRAIWWASVVIAGVLITGIAASRVYLGVHWFTDVIQGMLLGALYLVALEELFAHHHRHRSCPLVVTIPRQSDQGSGAAKSMVPMPAGTDRHGGRHRTERTRGSDPGRSRRPGNEPANERSPGVAPS